MGTFADYSVLPVNMLAKVRDDAPFEPICYIGCGATTGLGAALFAAKVDAGSSVVVSCCKRASPARTRDL